MQRRRLNYTADNSWTKASKLECRVSSSTYLIPPMATQTPPLKIDRYVVIHVATTCDEHGVYVTKDSAEVIEIGWILLEAGTLEEVSLDD